MKWGRRWGRWPIQKGFPDRVSRWGGEWDQEAPPGTVKRQVFVSKDGRIIPCNDCKRKPNCAMFRNYIKLWRHQEYIQGTMALGDCTIFAPQHMPGSIHREVPRDRTSGKQPT